VISNDNDDTKTYELLKIQAPLCFLGRGLIQRSKSCAECMCAPTLNGYTLTAKYVSFDCSAFLGSWLTLQGACENITIEIKTTTEDPPLQIVLADEGRPTVIPESWHSAIRTILQDYQLHQQHTQQQQYPLILAVAGAKGVGKSTCVRHVINTLLSCANTTTTNNAVYLLDADVGQPELTPPGMLSLTHLTEPLLCPPYANLVLDSHQQQHNRNAVWFGSNTSQTDPTRFLECVQGLVEQATCAQEQQQQYTMVVNLDGWVKGLGESLLQTLVGKLPQPNHVLALLGTHRSQQFELVVGVNGTTIHRVTAYNVVAAASCAQYDPVASVNTNACVTDTTTTSLPQQSSPSICAGPKQQPSTLVRAHLAPLSISAALLRAQRLCTYFVRDASLWNGAIHFSHDTGIGDDECTIAHRLAHQVPYKISLDAVEWKVACGDDVHRNISSEASMLQVLNASIVGLCCRNTDIDQDTPTHLLPCVGLGIVRSIDLVGRRFYILTPVPIQELKRVNVLVRASSTIALPLEAYFRGVESEAFVYQSLGCDNQKVQILGGEPMQSRNSIARNSQQHQHNSATR
jgi:polynucleotide 5'-hydroxyl-kinase GRC3/NOL9